MNITRKERLELNDLSKEVFGTSSRWSKIVKTGVVEMVTEDLSEIVPGENPGDPDTERVVKVPVKYDNGAIKYRVRHYTVDEVRTLMNERKTQLENFKAQIAKQQAEQAARKAALAKAAEAAGSAV